MWNILLEIRFENMDLEEFFKYRIINKECRDMMTYIGRKSKILPSRWNCYLNITGIAELFPLIEKFDKIGHRGYLLDALYMRRIMKLWLDSPISRFSTVLLECGINNVKHLVLNCGKSCDLLNKTSKINWPDLEYLCIITETISSQDIDIELSSWKMPKLQQLMIGTSIPIFPMCLAHLPVSSVKELSVVSDMPPNNIPFLVWFISFMQMWTQLQYNPHLEYIRFDFLIPETDSCICALIEGLNATFIKRLYLRPCSISTALKILNNTTVTIVTMTERPSQWMLVKFGYGDRIEFI